MFRRLSGKDHNMGIGEACAIASALVWAGGVIVYKRLGESLAPTRLNFLKNMIVLALVLPTVFLVEGLRPPALSPMTLALCLVSGALGIALADTLYFKALNDLGAARVGIIGNLYSPFVIVLSFAFLGERLTGLQLVGFALVSLGVLLVSQPEGRGVLADRRARHGLLLGIAAIFLMATAVVMIKRVLEAEPLLWIVLLRLLGGVLGLFLIFLWRGERIWPLARPGHTVNWPTLVFAAFIGQYVSMILWLAGYKYTTASVAAILNESASVFIVLLAAIFLHEALTRRKLAGVALTLSGVGCMLWV